MAATRFVRLRYIAKGKVVPTSENLEPYQIVFSFPTRSRSESFELVVPDDRTTTKIRIEEETYWKYHPIFLPYGDTFPRWQRCS